MNTDNKNISVRAIKTLQKANIIYSFFIPGEDILKIADIQRVERAKDGELKGFQRRGIQTHVKSIREYLNKTDIIFLHAITLSFSSDITFKQSRGPSPEGVDSKSIPGILSIPVFEEGRKCALIIDGQQRTLALSESDNKDILVPVVGFVTDNVNTQREQFLLLNKGRPLESRLLNEIIAETDVVLPRQLAKRKVPSRLCDALDRTPNSPFYGIISRYSDQKDKKSAAVVRDTAIQNMINQSFSNPLGALYNFKGSTTQPADLKAMYDSLVSFWSIVKEVFPDAWGKDPRKSRLMHSAGIQ